jgi:hypothetical protein
MSVRNATPIVVDLVELEKAGGGRRVLTRLGPAAEDAYATIVGSANLRVHGHGIVVGAGGLSAARRAWTRAVRHAVAGSFVIRSDVRACYPSITPGVAAAAFAQAGADRATADRLDQILHGCRREGSDGLPVGPAPSAIVADAVLAGADRAVARTGATVVRWVDDVVIAATGRRAAYRAFDAWCRALGEAGLRPHEGKTIAGANGGSIDIGSAWSGPARGMMRPP